MGWPFDKVDLKPGSLHEVRASCTFARRVEGKTEVEFESVKAGEILMSLGYEKTDDVVFYDYEFKFLWGEKEIFLPITIPEETELTDEGIAEAMEIALFAFVKSASHGVHPPYAATYQRKIHLIGDSWRDDDGYDEFH